MKSSHQRLRDSEEFRELAEQMSVSPPIGAAMRSTWRKGRLIAAMSRKKPERMTLPEALRQALRNSGRSSYELQSETGVNHGVILRFMKGERDIRLETAEKLAAAVGLTVKVPPAKETETD